ncbi:MULTISPECIES: neutral zinc metallopeptidase [unclassified Flavobacterium]|uniref:KPN_02809 family neutral zinc metallopeptidase n=1 Tax=unclassified Flavobacterium TaxID=196869 RepID=UPI00086C4F37|nr:MULTISPECIES: neutral zinc metallopeptidase [unclassified Flavobacterium]MBN9284895.1 neutral zinc metallopeptidase [Flavobacterium sp.]ODS80399.1 MAG: metalloprotease [Chryseobacterium sp. SCN 40-13]OJV72208.1 MAG: metalloprotease [Flavobacterium sp. 40-81]
MKWKGQSKSDNVEDRRGMSTGGKVVAGGGIIGIIVLLLNMFGGENAQQLAPILEQLQQGQSTEQVQQRELTPEEIEMGDFAATMLGNNDSIWNKVFKENKMIYEKPGMVLFTDNVTTACGSATAASGPFYCPADRKVYMDLAFFDELRTRFGAQGGDFAIAYVIAHEVGHHVQTLLGTSGKVHKLQQGLSQTAANKLSVSLELQADFYAGLWAHYNQKYLEAGDIEEALSAAQAVGDDAIQKKMQGHVTPDSFTHGTSAQRIEWFKRGYETGDIRKGDTFAELN